MLLRDKTPQVNTNIVNVFSNSFDSNSSTSSMKVRKETKVSNVEDDILDKIQIKDVNENNSMLIDKDKTIKKSESIKKKNNKIMINISTIFNKSNNYHKKRNNNNDEYRPIKTEASEKGNLNESSNESIALKKKISELLEQNAKILNQKNEIENKNKELKQTVSKLKKYIIDNKIQDINYYKKELNKYKSEIMISNETIAMLKSENDFLKGENAKIKKENISIQSVPSSSDNNNNEQSTPEFERKTKTFTTFKTLQSYSLDPDQII